MAYRFGVLTMADVDDYTLINNVGQGVVYQDLLKYLLQREADMQAALAVFVEGQTELYTENYKLPGGGMLQRRGGQAQSAAVKAGGSWDTAYPLEDFGAQIAWTDVVMGYMTVNEFNRHVQTVEEQDRNTLRFEMLRALMNDGGGSYRTFTDPLWGSLHIQPLANGDATVYSPVVGSSTEATENLYLESGYAASAISDTNNPFVTMVAKFVAHFGRDNGGNNVAIFINTAQEAKTRALTDFVAVEDRFIRTSSLADVPQNLPSVPGTVIGRVSGAWIVVWDWIPANYMVGIQLGVEPPLKMRVDPASTGIQRGLSLVATDQIYPFTMAHWRHRFGFGVGNRLNGLVMELGTGGTYTIPTAYA